MNLNDIKEWNNTNQQILQRIDTYVEEIFNNEYYSDRPYNVDSVYLHKWHIDMETSKCVYITVGIDMNLDGNRTTKYEELKITMDDFLGGNE